MRDFPSVNLTCMRQPQHRTYSAPTIWHAARASSRAINIHLAHGSYALHLSTNYGLNRKSASRIGHRKMYPANMRLLMSSPLFLMTRTWIKSCIICFRRYNSMIKRRPILMKRIFQWCTMFVHTSQINKMRGKTCPRTWWLIGFRAQMTQRRLLSKKMWKLSRSSNLTMTLKAICPKRATFLLLSQASAIRAQICSKMITRNPRGCYQLSWRQAKVPRTKMALACAQENKAQWIRIKKPEKSPK